MASWREEPRGSGRWRKQIWHLGRPIKLTFTGSKADADLYEARRRIELGAIDPATSESVFDFEHYCAERYRPHAQATLRPSTWSVRKFQLENLLLHFGRVKLPKLREPEIEAYKMKRLADGADKVTVNTELNVLSATLTYARETLKLPCPKRVLSGLFCFQNFLSCPFVDVTVEGWRSSPKSGPRRSTARGAPRGL
jgi:hypothetical protein